MITRALLHQLCLRAVMLMHKTYLMIIYSSSVFQPTSIVGSVSST